MFVFRLQFAALAMMGAATVRAQETWRGLNSGTTVPLWSVTFGGGRWVAVGEQGIIVTSTDGVTWTRRSSGSTRWLVGVGYGNGRFVAVGEAGMILISDDGATWSAQN